MANVTSYLPKLLKALEVKSVDYGEIKLRTKHKLLGLSVIEFLNSENLVAKLKGGKNNPWGIEADIDPMKVTLASGTELLLYTTNQQYSIVKSKEEEKVRQIMKKYNIVEAEEL